MSKPVFQMIALEAISPSPTNPRKNFAHDALQELADTIKTHGVLQPILARPLPGARVPETGKDVQFEIVSGERRYRASILAGQTHIPATIRALTDLEVLQIQVIENLQREGLRELEEAQGYELLIANAMSPDDIAKKIGKSRRYVYNRLKLLSLCQEGQAALNEGRLDASKALEIATIPAHLSQIKALRFAAPLANKEALPGIPAASPPSLRELTAWINNHCRIVLIKAPFDIKDELLTNAGACTTCPKRSSQEPDLFAERQSADMCLDDVCYSKKCEAHALLKESEAAAKAKAQQQEPKSNDTAFKTSEQATDSQPKEKSGTWAFTPAPDKKQNKSLHDAHQALDMTVPEFVDAIKQAITETTASHLLGHCPTATLDQLLGKTYFYSYATLLETEICELDADDPSELIDSSPSEKAVIILRYLAAESLQVWHRAWCDITNDSKADNINLTKIAQAESQLNALGVDVKAVQASAKAKHEARLKTAKEVAAKQSAQPTAKTKSTKPPKTTKEQAAKGIAQALQKQEQQAQANSNHQPNLKIQKGSRVKIKDNEQFVAERTALYRYIGREGKVSKEISSNQFEVSFAGAAGGKRDFYKDELEVLA